MLCHECGSTIEDGQKDRAPVLARLCLKCRSDLRHRYNVKFPRCCRTQRMLSTVDSRFVPRSQYVTGGSCPASAKAGNAGQSRATNAWLCV